MSGIFILENTDSAPLFHASPCLSRLRTLRPDLLQRSKIPQLDIFKYSGLCALNIQDSKSLSFLDLGLHTLISMTAHLLCFETLHFSLWYCL